MAASRAAAIAPVTDACTGMTSSSATSRTILRTAWPLDQPEREPPTVSQPVTSSEPPATAPASSASRRFRARA